MRIFIALLLTLVSYGLIISFLFFVFFHHSKQLPKPKEVYIHTAIPVKKLRHSLKTNSIPKKVKKRVVKKTIPKPEKKIVKNIKQITKAKGSKSSLTKSGNVDFNDIFKNVEYNVPTKKVNLAKSELLSRFKQIEKHLKKIKNIDITSSRVNISVNVVNKVDKNRVDELIKNIYNIWNELSFIPGEYVLMHIISDGKEGLKVIILDSNIDKERQLKLVNEIESLNFSEKLDLFVKLQTKVKE